MAGLMPPGGMGAQDPNAQDPTQVADDEGANNASPEEQDAYEDLVTTAMDLVYGGGTVREGVVKMLDGDPADLQEIFGDLAQEWMQPDPGGGGTMWDAKAPIIALAATTVVVLLEAVEKTGIMDKLGDDAGTVILHAGQEVLEDIADLAEKAGIRNYTEAEMTEAFRMGADLYREAGAEAGVVNLDAAKDEFNEIITADKEGRTDQLLPGLEEAASTAEQAPAEQPQ